MPEVKILQQSAEKMTEIDQSFDLIYMDPPFGLQRDFKMLEQDGEEKGFSDNWESFDDYILWYADIINSAWNKLNKDGWMYLHNNFIGNALVLSHVNKNIRSAFYTNISWKRSGPKNNIKNGWGNIVDSIMVLMKRIVFKIKMNVDIMLSQKPQEKRAVQEENLYIKVMIQFLGGE